MVKHFTDDEKNKIKREIEHAEMFGSTNDETMLAIEKIIGRPISRPWYFKLRKETINDNEVSTWIKNFARAGFIHHYQQRIKELMYSNQILLKMIEEEYSKPQQNKHLLNTLIRNHREHEALLLAAGFGSPVLLQVKELITNVEHNNGYNITNKEPGEDNKGESGDTNTTNREPNDNRYDA